MASSLSYLVHNLFERVQKIVKMNVIIKNKKRVELNTRLAGIFLNAQILNMI